MKVVVDTSVWSLALRRKSPSPNPHTQLLSQLLQEGRVSLMGIVRQELLSGIRDQKQYESLRDRLRSFPEENLKTEDHEIAASYYNLCMTKGVQGSSVDFLICAFAVHRDYQILTSDPDFEHYAKHLPIVLLHPSNS